jgi:hypothetical protein
VLEAALEITADAGAAAAAVVVVHVDRAPALLQPDAWAGGRAPGAPIVTAAAIRGLESEFTAAPAGDGAVRLLGRGGPP